MFFYFVNELHALITLIRSNLIPKGFLICLGKLYKDADFVEERHRHRWEVNPELVPKFEEKGFKFVGQDEEGERMEIFELESKCLIIQTVFIVEVFRQFQLKERELCLCT